MLVLLKEINTYKDHFNTINTIYIGGGIPSVLKPKQLDLLLKNLSKINSKEFTIEVSPSTYNEEKGLIFKKHGVNRISLLIQTFNNDLLKYLNLINTKEKTYQTINNLRKIGINNISVDLMYGIPNQSIEMIISDMEIVNTLKINHISYYSLIIEKNSHFYKKRANGLYKDQCNDLEGEMFELINKKLTSFGYEHYEITNFAKKNKYSLHNIIYWKQQNYIGVGLGSHGYIDGFRTYNNIKLEKYYINNQSSKELQTKDNIIQDTLIFGLRMSKGVNVDQLEKKYGFNILLKYPDLKNVIKLGLVELNKGYLSLTKLGITYGNKVFEVFI